VGLENGLEGLLHISELADHKVENPEEIVKVGEQIEVKILRVDPEERKIGLSRKRVEWAEEAEAAEAHPSPASGTPGIPPSELKGGVGHSTGPLIQPIKPSGKSHASHPAGSSRGEHASHAQPGQARPAASTEPAQAEQAAKPEGQA